MNNTEENTMLKLGENLRKFRFVGQIINPSYSLYHNQSQISIWKAKPPNLFWQGGLNVLQLHTHSNGFIYSALSHFCDDNSVVVFDYPLVYPKGNGERLAVYLTHSLITTSFVAAIYLCGAAIFWCLILGLFFRLQSIRLYSIAILLRTASQ